MFVFWTTTTAKSVNEVCSGLQIVIRSRSEAVQISSCSIVILLGKGGSGMVSDQNKESKSRTGTRGTLSAASLFFRIS